MKLIWDKINEWKFWALANNREDFYQLLLECKIVSKHGVHYIGKEPYLNEKIHTHELLKKKAQKLLSFYDYQEFVRELYNIREEVK